MNHSLTRAPVGVAPRPGSPIRTSAVVDRRPGRRRPTRNVNRVTTSATQGDKGQIADFARAVCDRADAIRIPQLFASPPRGALYFKLDRHGVTTVAIQTRFLDEALIDAVVRFRFAQYLDLGYISQEAAWRQGLDTEPPGSLRPDDVHYLSGCSQTGRILCYQCLQSPPPAPPMTRLRDRDRPLLPYEEYYGWGVYNRLRIMPDLLFKRVWDAGRFMKNQRLAADDPLALRAPIETVLALYHSLVDDRRLEVDAFVMMGEEDGIIRNLAFFQTPTVIMRHTLPTCGPEDLVHPIVHERDFHTCAAFVGDLPSIAERVLRIEEAIARPGAAALPALFALKRDATCVESSLMPEGGLDPLENGVLSQTGMPYAQRQRLRRAGRALRRIPLFQDLSETEATALATRLEPVTLRAGARVFKAGEAAYFVVQSGRVERVGPGPARRLFPPGSIVNPDPEMDLTKSPAQAVAASACRGFRLAKAIEERLLARHPEIRLALATIDTED